MKRMKQLLALGLATAMSLSLAACSGGDDNKGGTTPAADGTRSVYRVMYAGEASSFNYLFTGDTHELKVCANVVDTLVEYDTYGVMKPSLAESWEANADNTEWTFHIRPGVKWVDYQGNEVADVTANDWVSAAKYVLDAKNSSSSEYMYEGIVKGAAEYYAYTAYLVESDNGSKTADGNPIEVVAPVDFATVGVKAVDDLTLVYTMEQPTPYFPSVLSYASYMPVYGPFLDEVGESFGVSNDTLLYNGAYLLSDYQPQTQRILTKNPTYWDKDNVFIEEIQQIYNASTLTLAPESFLRDDVDNAQIGNDILSAWMDDPERKDMVAPSMVDNSYSYFFCFNLEPRFDAAYEPDNWLIAANNENFRQSVRHAIDRANALKIQDPYNPESLMNNTVTPANFAVGAGKDFTQYDAVKDFTNGDSFDADLARQFRDKAIPELEAAGAKLPIKVLMPYNSVITGWDKECQIIEQQVEGVLGSDYIDIVIEAGPTTGFLSEVRRAGKFALMKNNWGADYADPQTWTDPFNAGGVTQNSTYNFMYTVPEAVFAGTPATSKTPETQALVAQYVELLHKAKGITTDIAARYEAFAEAEAFLIDHAFIVPFSVDTNGYVATRLNDFERQYAPYGLAPQRYKGMHVYDEPVSMDVFNARYEAWKTERAAALAAAEQ